MLKKLPEICSKYSTLYVYSLPKYMSVQDKTQKNLKSEVFRTALDFEKSSLNPCIGDARIKMKTYVSNGKFWILYGKQKQDRNARIQTHILQKC